MRNGIDSALRIPNSALNLVVLRAAALLLALFEFALFALFDFAAALGVFVANRVAQLLIQLLERRGVVGLESDKINWHEKFYLGAVSGLICA